MMLVQILRNRFMEKLTLITLLYLLPCLIAQSPIEIELSPQTLQTKQNQPLQTQAMPGLDMNDIKLTQLINNTYSFSNMCRIQPATLQIQPLSTIYFEEQHNKSQIISRLEDLKNMRNVVDLVGFKGFYYVLFKQGFINVYSKGRKGLEKVGNLLGNRTLGQGYFTKNRETLLYVSATEILKVNQTHLREITSYLPIPNFSYVRLFENNHLFISVENEGVYYYHYDEESSRVINRTFFNLLSILKERFIQIQDFAYHQEKNLLIVADFAKGVYFFKLENLQLAPVESQFINRSHCQNVVLTGQMLYLTCGELLKYNLSNSQIQTKPLSLYAEDLVVTEKGEILLVGGYHLSYYKNWYWYPVFGQIKEPTRVIYDNTDLVYINGYGLINEKVIFSPEKLLCDTQEQGNFQLMLYGEERCKRNPTANLEEVGIKENQMCLYSSKVTIEVWEAFNIQWIFIVIGALFCLAALIMFVIWVLIKRRLANKTYNQLVEVQDTPATEETFRQTHTHGLSDPTGRQLARDQIKPE